MRTDIRRDPNFNEGVGSPLAVIAAEAKANRLTPEGLRGAPARVKRYVQDMVLAPSVQSERLANLISKAQSGDAASIAVVTGLGINPEAVDRVIRLSVTLDDLSVLSAAEANSRKSAGCRPITSLRQQY
jgi:hypothetical protein